jgi:fermentation-respiration switch protein FrsA (DUF1100 family)
MKRVFRGLAGIALLIGVVALPWSSTVAQSGQEIESGTFELWWGTVRLGQETFSFQRTDTGYRLISTMRLRALGIRMSQQLDLTSDLRPISYALDALTRLGSLEARAQITGNQAWLSVKSGAGAFERVVTGEGEFVILDYYNHFGSYFYVPSHFWLLHERIKRGLPMPAKLTALVPQEVAAPFLFIYPPSTTTLTSGGRTLEAQKYLLVLGWLDAELYSTEGKLVGVEAPQHWVGLHRYDLFPWGFKPPAAPEPIKPEGVQEIEVSFANKEVQLAGTLAIPPGATGPSPAVLFIHGSGPQDRDGNAPTGPGTKINDFKVLAYKLAEIGIASLRYDDRGVGLSSGDWREANLEDLVSDARAALEYLKSRSEVDPQRLFVLGWSEGGIIAPILASEGRVAGLITLAAPAHSLEWIILYQTEFILRAEGHAEDKIQEGLRRTRALFDWIKQSQGEWEDYTCGQLQQALPWLTCEEFEFLKESFALSWYRQHFAHDPLATIQQVKVPVLIIQGDKDIQVPKEEALLLAEELRKAGNEQVTLQILPDLNHGLRYHPEIASIGATHVDEPMDERVLRLISDWLRAQTSTSLNRTEGL